MTPTLASVPDAHRKSAAEVCAQLGAEPEQGLRAAEAAARLARHGPNAIREKARRPAWRMLLDQFTDLMIVVLIGAAIVSGMVGDLQDTIAIVVILILNGAIGFVQEYRAERAIAALRKMAATSARVVRDGAPHPVAATELVPGDVVLLEAGNVVPADLRLLEALQCKINEAALTGESATVEKHTDALDSAELPLGDRMNMAYKGTIVTYGRARGVTVATGMATELGRIAQLLEGGEDSKTPLQKRLAHFGARLAIVVLAICVIVFAVGILRGEPALLMLMTAVSLAVAAIPEALPAVVTISLALGARKMVREHALIRRLPAVETLGSVTYICSDKTGTLTQNTMRVAQIAVDGRTHETAEWPRAGEPWQILLLALAISNDASHEAGNQVAGDPTEAALLEAAARSGYDKRALEADAPRVKELAFDSARMLMTTFHQRPEDVIAFTKGSPETVVALCHQALSANGSRPLESAKILETADRMAADGLRVLAFAYRVWREAPSSDDPEELERDLVFLGLVGLEDPPRPEAEPAVRMCKSAGITPVLVTGDHPATARAIATRVGILGDDGARVLTGLDLAHLSDHALERAVEDIRVYARVDPAQKIRIVRALQKNGEFVAMTGDGVNDAPALKRADIGIAMGRGGTDVAREASSLVLLDDNFATIVSAVREGRRIFDNILKFIRYTMTSNTGEILTIFLAPFLGLPIPLLPIHILWINLVTDGLPGLALSAEPAEKAIMKRPPRPPAESVFARGVWQQIVWIGLLMAGVTLLAQAWSMDAEKAKWQTMAFTVLTLSQMGNVLAIRSDRESLFSLGLFSNRPLLGAVLVTFALQMAVVYIPALNSIFRTVPLDLADLGLCLALSSIVFVAVELQKWFFRMRSASAPDGVVRAD
ncbi:MAG: calcium-translocating P-type ATPase, PMCA-type [Betaproteobacteria bacterium]|nr:calcium-translocating P-type ATPase, PMCA-type [Betaproteobacteria bacterium]